MSSVPERFRIIGIKNTGLLDGPHVILALRDLTDDILVRVGADFVEGFFETGSQPMRSRQLRMVW